MLLALFCLDVIALGALGLYGVYLYCQVHDL